MHRLRRDWGVVVALALVAVARASAQPPPQPPPAPVRVGGAIGQPRKVQDAKPIYPPDAQSAHVQGVVIIEVTLDPSGKVGEAKVVRSIPMLDDAAVAAVKQWEFTPTLINGVPMPVIMTVTVNFSLSAPGPSARPIPPAAIQPPIVLFATEGQNGKRYVFEITPDRAAKLPLWDQPSTGEPPLSMSDARRLATTWIKGKAPQAEAFELAASSLVRAMPSAGSPKAPTNWYYSIGFDHIVGGRRLPGGLESTVVVLLDGSIVEPRVEQQEPRPERVYRLGDAGVRPPRPVFQARTNYTSDAMRARVQGSVLLEAIVNADGTVGAVTVVRSLDPTFGLDQEAIKAAKQWRFEPATRAGVPVPMAVSIEMSFTLGKER